MVVDDRVVIVVDNDEFIDDVVVVDNDNVVDDDDDDDDDDDSDVVDDDVDDNDDFIDDVVVVVDNDNVVDDDDELHSLQHDHKPCEYFTSSEGQPGNVQWCQPSQCRAPCALMWPTEQTESCFQRNMAPWLIALLALASIYSQLNPWHKKLAPNKRMKLENTIYAGQRWESHLINYPAWKYWT